MRPEDGLAEWSSAAAREGTTLPRDFQASEEQGALPKISRTALAVVPHSVPGCTRFPTGSQPFPGSYSGIPTVSLKTSSLFPAATLPFLKRDMAFSLDGPKADRRGGKGRYGG
ncbi:TPA: hypothetical protein ACGST8_001700 [Escherichia coli]|nr:hypothetical protein [Escherichia coli]HEA3613770.1 hypothetical protein [Escherichia coli]